jgi:basic membrane protein A and related proteins
MPTVPPPLRLVALATAAAAVVALAGCSAPPSTSTSTAAAGDSDVLPCLVSDVGGFNDKSFNQSAFEGITAAAQALGVTPVTVESKTSSDYAPNIASVIDQGCTLVVTVGFNLADATKAAAEANPDVHFTIVDDDSIDLPNVRPITFDASQPSFLAGYAAASYSTTGSVGTFGGMQIPPVTAFMDGFVYGVDYYNQQNGTSVKSVGWDPASQVGVFTGDFVAGAAAKAAAQGVLDQDVDVLYPVGGPIFQSAGEAIRDAGRDIAMIGVDVDLYETAPELSDLFLTSVLRQVPAGIEDTVAMEASGTFSPAPYVGTLENDGVDIAPFHDFADKVNPDLTAKLAEVRAGIIDGSIPTRP